MLKSREKIEKRSSFANRGKNSKKIPKRILMVDNYDSFTYNIVQYIGELGFDVCVWRSKEVDIDDVAEFSPDRIIISPGPGWPKDAGISKGVIERFYKDVPILGICLGHQCIGEVFGARIVHAKRLMHGKVSKIYHTGRGIFLGIPQGFIATRYHSLVIDSNGLPDELEIIAHTQDNEIMAIRHKRHQVWGVQFHPESILTEYGHKLLENFLLLKK